MINYSIRHSGQYGTFQCVKITNIFSFFLALAFTNTWAASPQLGRHYYVQNALNNPHTLNRLKDDGTATPVAGEAPPVVVDNSDDSRGTIWELRGLDGVDGHYSLISVTGMYLQDGNGGNDPQLTVPDWSQESQWSFIETSNGSDEYYITSRATNAQSRLCIDNTGVLDMCAANETGNGARWEFVETDYGLTAKDFTAGSISIPGGAMSQNYRYMEPLNYNASNSYPLVLFLHGGGERGTNNTAQINAIPEWANAFGNEETRENHPAFLLVPQSGTARWSDITGEVMALINQITANYSIDKNRIYIMGHSMGGMGSNAMLGAYPDFFAAAAPVCGREAIPHSFTPIWFFHGAKDGTVNTDGSRDLVRRLRSEGDLYVLYTEYPGVTHNAWDWSYDEPDFIPWLFSQTKTGGAAPGAPLHVQVNAGGNRAVITWAPPASAVDEIMHYHVYKGDQRLTTGVFDITGTDSLGISQFLRVETYTDNSYSPGDEYKVSTVNFRNQESGVTTPIKPVPQF